MIPVQPNTPQTANLANQNGGGVPQPNLNGNLNGRSVTNVTEKSLIQRLRPFLQCIPVVSLIFAQIFAHQNKEYLERIHKEYDDAMKVISNKQLRAIINNQEYKPNIDNPDVQKAASLLANYKFESLAHKASFIPGYGNVTVIFMRIFKKQVVESITRTLLAQKKLDNR